MNIEEARNACKEDETKVSDFIDGFEQGVEKFLELIKKDSTILLNDNGIMHYHEYAISIFKVENIAKELLDNK